MQQQQHDTAGQNDRQAATPLKVAIQGIAGCFHDAAAHVWFDGRRPIEIVESETFERLFANLDADASMVAVMAIDNTIAGSILPNHELLRRSNLRVVGEHKMRISHVLCALPGQSIKDITEVHSHPMALMQCQQYLRSHPAMRKVEDFDTAGAAAEIAAKKIKGRAAVCPRFAADLYGLQVLEEGIETNKHNFTRFLVIADPLAVPDIVPDMRLADKASVVFTLPHAKGALSKILTIFTFYDINLTKIQSTPIIGREWEYRFYADLTFDNPVRYQQAITAVRPLLGDFRELGLYNECDTPAEVPAV